MSNDRNELERPAVDDKVLVKYRPTQGNDTLKRTRGDVVKSVTSNGRWKAEILPDDMDTKLRVQADERGGFIEKQWSGSEWGNIGFVEELHTDANQSRSTESGTS